MLYEMIDDAKGGLGGFCKIERDKALDILDEVRGRFPAEISEARKLMDTRNEYLEKAKAELALSLEPSNPRLSGNAALLRELSAIGNNINQIAHTVNAQKYAADSQVDRAVALVQRAWRLVKGSF